MGIISGIGTALGASLFGGGGGIAQALAQIIAGGSKAPASTAIPGWTPGIVPGTGWGGGLIR